MIAFMDQLLLLHVLPNVLRASTSEAILAFSSLSEPPNPPCQGGFGGIVLSACGIQDSPLMRGLARFPRTPQSLPDTLSLTQSSRLRACPEPLTLILQL